MKWQRIPLGPLQTNAYILSNTQKDCVIFDPGGDGQKLNTVIRQQGLTPVAILLTHAHFDHIGAIDDVLAQWNIPVYIHEKEKEWLKDPALNGSASFIPGHEILSKVEPTILPKEGVFSIGEFTFDLFTHQAIHQEVLHIIVKKWELFFQVMPYSKEVLGEQTCLVEVTTNY